MKNLSIEKILLAFILLLTLANGCNSCKGNREHRTELKSMKKRVDSLENTIKLSNETTYKNISKEIEMLLIIENEIDGKNKKSTEIKEIIKNYK